MRRSTRLVMVINDLRFFLSHRFPLAVAAREAGFEVHVATPGGRDVEILRKAGLIHHEVPFARSVDTAPQELKSLWWLMKLYRRLKPDVVHHVTIKPIIYGGLAARLTGSPGLVSAVTGLGFLYMGNEGWKRAAQWALAGYLRFILRRPRSMVIFQNPDDRAVYLNSGTIDPESAVLIRGAGVDTRVFDHRPEPAGRPIILLPARMLWNKGVGDFVRAAEIINRDGPKADFVLAGDHDRNPSAVPREQLEAWNTSGQVKWLGYRRDMPRVLQQSHVVCLPAHYREGLPKSLLEAAACGRPVITTDVPGCREAVRHGENGLLIPPMDVEALVKALERLIGDPTLRRAMGEKGREMAENSFSLNHVIEETLALYRRLSPCDVLTMPGR